MNTQSTPQSPHPPQADAGESRRANTNDQSSTRVEESPQLAGGFFNSSISPLVTVIVVNWNGKAVIEDCLLSLTQQTYSPVEIIVVDNGSKDSSVALVQEKFGAIIHLVQNPINLGFAGGNNVGIRVSRGKYILLLNNDATADPRWVQELVRVAESDPGIGMCASKIYSFDEPRVLDSAGGLLIYRDGLSRGRGRLERDQGQYDRVEEVLLPSGCACLYRREMLNQIGLFDEDFFAYSDDTDLGLRAQIAGWKCLYVPTAVATHRYSASTGRYSPLKAFLAERNRVWVATKNFPLPVLILSPFFTLWRLFLHVYALLRKRGVTGRFTERHTTGTLFLAILKAYSSAIAHLPKMWTKRRQILKTRKVSSSVIYSWLKNYKITAWELAFKE